MFNKNIFENIIHNKTPAKILYKDQIATAFYDSKPQAPIHFLIVPNKYIASLDKITKNDKLLIGHLIYIAVKITKKLGISNTGYRLIINCNKHAGQEIDYLHLHIIGGAQLSKNIN